MFRALSVHLQEEYTVYIQHMVLSLSTRVRGGLSVHILSENCIQCIPPEDEHLGLETCRGT